MIILSYNGVMALLCRTFARPGVVLLLLFWGLFFSGCGGPRGETKTSNDTQDSSGTPSITSITPSSGSTSGVSIEIQGTDFDATSTVTVDGFLCTNLGC